MSLKKIIPFVSAFVIFVIASVLYFSPVLSGQQLKQGDITRFMGMSKEIVDFRAEKGTEPYWTGSAFSGMPAFQLSAYYPNDFVKYLDDVIRFLPRPADYVFLYFFGFFLLLIALKTDWKLAILGAISFGFSTYLIIIFGAGHNAKAHAIGYMPIVLAGVLWVYQKRYLLGFVVTAFAMALEVYTNHPQMTYYLGFSLIILGIVELVDAFKEKTLPTFAKQVSIIMVAVLLGIGVNSTRLLAMKQYADQSTRGKSELTITSDGAKKIAATGLEYDYITEYSYGIAETVNLFIPRFMGGGTIEELGSDSNFYQLLKKEAGASVAKSYSKQVFTYWGNQPIVEAPAYIGAVIFFLFFLGMFLVKGKLKNWLVATTVFVILLSWGKNFAGFTNFFIEYVPLYNKFRAVSSIQVIAELSVPLLGILALKNFFLAKISSEEKKEALKKAFYVAGGIALFFTLFGTSLFAFEGLRDEQYSQLPGLKDALISDRKSMLFSDSIRSLLLVTASAGLLWFLLKEKLKQTQVIIALGVLILFDLISIDKRYVNEDDFTAARKVKKPFTASVIDKQILKDKTHYRVANFSTNPMQDARTSYFHQSIGGYHAAKLGRYQELFDYQIAKNNMGTLNMLNVKYFILGGEKGEQLQVNPNANGNAWFVEKILIVNSANEEIKALDSLQTKEVSVIEYKNIYEAYNSDYKTSFEKDSTATIQLSNYDVTTLTYQSKTAKEQFAVFSEIYYKDGWNAYVDGELTPHVSVNYLLRGMLVPAGEHTITFKFEPTVIKDGNAITLTSYALLFFIPLGWFFYKRRKDV